MTRWCFSFFFSSFFFFLLNSGPQDLFLQPPSCLFIAKQGIHDEGSSPRRVVTSFWSNLAHPGELVTSPSSYFVALASQRLAWESQGSEKVWKWPFFPPFWVFPHSFLKRWKALRIAWQLVLSSSIRLARINMLANEGPQTKLGYDNCPSLLMFYWK